MKKHLIKILSMGLIALSATTLTTFKAEAAWKQDSTGWWYTEGDSYAKGWKNIDGKWYFFYDNGYMAHNTSVDGYVLSANGEYITKKANTNTSYGNLMDEDFKIENNTTLIQYATDHNYNLAQDVFYKPEDASFKTFRGISIGSSYDEVIKQYGTGLYFDFNRTDDLCRECPTLNSLAPVKVMQYIYHKDPDLYFINFYFNSNNKVVMILFMKNDRAAAIKSW